MFLLADKGVNEANHLNNVGLASLDGSANEYADVRGHISVKDAEPRPVPKSVPARIHQVFEEGAKCLVVDCFNAAGTMFRLCVDLATIGLLPQDDVEGLNQKVRRSLGLRLHWLLDTGRLPEALRDLSACIKDDGNDGAHAGNLTKPEAEDLIDFTTELLERIYTLPMRVEAAKERRERRRMASSSESD